LPGLEEAVEVEGLVRSWVPRGDVLLLLLMLCCFAASAASTSREGTTTACTIIAVPDTMAVLRNAPPRQSVCVYVCVCVCVHACMRKHVCSVNRV